MDRQGKEQIIGEIKESFAGVVSIVFAENLGLDVPTVTSMRAEFTKAGCNYRVLKNTLVKIAVKGSKLEPISKFLTGPTAVIWSNDSPSAPAKLALRFAKEQQKFVVKGGFCDGQAFEKPGVEQLAVMPGKPELQASMLMTFIAAPTDFVRTIAAGPQNFVYLIDARKRALEGQG
jgi:large subunit ribosomal protein L10